MAADDDKGLVDKAKDEIAKAAAKHAAKAVFDEAGRRARQAVDSALDSAEGWVGQEAASAEARREASGLPSTTPEAHWTDRYAEEGEAAFKRARSTIVVDEDEDEDEAAAAAAAERKAKAQEELARMKAALKAGGDPLLDEARKTLQKAQALRGQQEAVSLEDELEALAAAAAADAGSIDVETEASPERPTLAPEESVVEAPPSRSVETVSSFIDDELGEPDAGDTTPPHGDPLMEDPAMAALARARAARIAAADEDAPPVEPDPDEAVGLSDDPMGLAAAERALARAAELRGTSLTAKDRELDDVRAQARARAARIAEEAMFATPKAPVLPDLSADPTEGAQAPAQTPHGDPFADAARVLDKAKAARIASGATSDPHEDARRAARERIARMTQEAADATPPGASAFVGVGAADDPMARAQAALDRAKERQGQGLSEQALDSHQARMARARELLRQRAYEKSAAELAREVLEQQGDPTDPEQAAAEAIAEAERLRAKHEAIVEDARKKAQAWGEEMTRRAEATQQEIDRRMAAQEAMLTTVGTPEERTNAALEAAARARAKASGRDPEREAQARVELDRLKRRQAEREASGDGAAAAGKKDLLGGPLPTPPVSGTGASIDEDHASDDTVEDPDSGGEDVPKRRL